MFIITCNGSENVIRYLEMNVNRYQAGNISQSYLSPRLFGNAQKIINI